MENGHFKKITLACLLCLLTTMMGCYTDIGCWPRAEYQRTVQLSAPLPPGSGFANRTHNGSITITGADVTDCNLTATIIARAMTEENAQKLAGETKIKLEPSGNRLIAKIEKPTFMTNRSVCVNLDITVPNHTDLELTTHNGRVRITNITGCINGTTHNGGVTAEQTSGTIELHTHNGSVTCREVSGDVKLYTHNGKINAVYSKDAASVCNVSMETHNGGIDFTAPPNFSAVVEASTHNGSINSDLPITVSGKINRRKLTGTISTGEGKLHLESHNGSIKIR